jgi:hypothetical protein
VIEQYTNRGFLSDKSHSRALYGQITEPLKFSTKMSLFGKSRDQRLPLGLLRCRLRATCFPHGVAHM